MKKIIILLITAMVCFSLVLSGCGSSGDEEKVETESEKSAATEKVSEKSIYTETGTFPIVKEKIKLNFLSFSAPMIVDRETNEFTKYMEDKTNIEIGWELVPMDQQTEQVNLILASGDYPDVFYGLRINDTQEALYGVEQEVFVPLNELIDKYCPNVLKAFEDHGKLRGSITATDGNIYGIPSWNDCYHCTFGQKMWLNFTWMEKLGLSEPKTTDELYNVLYALVNNDPNGNNKKDEIGLIGATDGWYTNIDTYIMDSFILDSGMYDKKRQIVKDGKVMTIVNTPEYKEGLKFINKLYMEKLIYEGSFTQKSEMAKQLIANPDIAIVSGFAAGCNCSFIDAASNQERWRQYLTIAPVKGPGGKQYATYFDNWALLPGDFVISKECKYPEAAIRWADSMFTHEMSLIMQWGKKGEGWDDPEPGDVGIDGKPALHKILRPYSHEPQNYGFLNIGLIYNTNEYRFGEATDPDIDPLGPMGMEKLMFMETRDKYEPYKPTDCSVLPIVKLFASESDELQTINVELDKYIEESKIRFITGELSIENDWDEYVQNLDNIGLTKYIETYQKAYDRQYK